VPRVWNGRCSFPHLLSWPVGKMSGTLGEVSPNVLLTPEESRVFPELRRDVICRDTTSSYLCELEPVGL